MASPLPRTRWNTLLGGEPYLLSAKFKLTELSDVVARQVLRVSS